jgi:hypothetical protein
MPDHIHFFPAPYDLEYPFDNWVTYWERQFGKLHDHDDWRWQPHPFHHRLRNGESYSENGSTCARTRSAPMNGHSKDASTMRW